MKFISLTLLLVLLVKCECSKVFSVQNVVNQENNSLKRDLSTCNLYTSCSECSLQASCEWLNSQCVDDPGTSLHDFPFISEEAATNCYNYNEDYISLEDLDELVLKHNNVGSTLTNYICKWRLKISPEKPVLIKVHRSIGQQEDIVFERVREDGTIFASTSDDYSSCDSQETKTKYQKGVYIATVYTRVLSDHPTYSLTLSQPKGNSRDSLVVLVIIWTIAGCCMWILLMTIGCGVAYCVISRLKRRRSQKYLAMRKQSLELRVSVTLESMISSEFIHIQAKYQEKSCIICLEDFNNQDIVNVTNECEHLFHKDCLETWYRNMPVYKDLACPHCNCHNGID